MSFLASTISTSLARGLSTSARASAPIKEFVVIGGGLMGAGIAQVGLVAQVIDIYYIGGYQIHLIWFH